MSDRVKVQVRQESEVVILSIEGHLEAPTVNLVNERLHTALEGDCNQVVFDLKSLGYAASAGLRLFLHIAEKLKAKNGQLLLASVQHNVQKNIDLCGLSKMLPIYEDVESAINAVKQAVK